MSLSHAVGMNPRKAKLTAMMGTNPEKMPGRSAGGMTHDTAPNKDDKSLFGLDIGFAGPGVRGEPV